MNPQTPNEITSSAPLNTGMCCRCYDENVPIVPAPCEEKPEALRGAPIGMYHCPDCGAMVIAGLSHPELCVPCSKFEHPYFDKPSAGEGVQSSRDRSPTDSQQPKTILSADNRKD